MQTANPILRFLYCLPLILAVGAWVAFSAVACDAVEHNPENPISLSSFIAPVPQCPTADIPARTLAFVRLPLPDYASPIVSRALESRDPVRGPPA